MKKFKKGEKSKLVVSSKYAYGSHGSEEYGIPPQSEVEYTLELLDFTRVCIVTTISVVPKIKCFFINIKSSIEFINLLIIKLLKTVQRPIRCTCIYYAVRV